MSHPPNDSVGNVRLLQLQVGQCTNSFTIPMSDCPALHSPVINKMQLSTIISLIALNTLVSHNYASTQLPNEYWIPIHSSSSDDFRELQHFCQILLCQLQLLVILPRATLSLAGHSQNQKRSSLRHVVIIPCCL